MLQKARFEKGKELLEAEFRSLLTRYSKPVPPVLILDAIGGDEDMEVQEDVTLEHLPEAVLQDIICISAWLVEYGRNQGGHTQTLLSYSYVTRMFEISHRVCFFICRLHERVFPSAIQSAGSVHQGFEGAFPQEQRQLCNPLPRRTDQTQGDAHQEGSEKTRSVTFSP